MTQTYAVPTTAHPIEAIVRVPASKSIMNRALICAALADGTSELEGVAPGADTRAMIECLQALGIGIERSRGVGDGDMEVLTVIGHDGRLTGPPTTLQTGLAGTTSRFLTALAALGSEPYTIDGDGPLRERPMGPLHDALVALGADVEPHGEHGHLPVTITGPASGGIPLLMPGDVSSQYLSALMMIGPYLPGGLEIHLTTRLVSAPYVWMTAAVMRSFAAEAVSIHNERVITVRPCRYTAAPAYTIEPDASSASYPLAIAAIRGGTVKVPGFDRQPLQGDIGFGDILAAMGCEVRRDDDGIRVSRDPDRPLVGVDVDMSDMSDLVPTLAVVAATASSPSTISGVGFIRSKESDRLGDLTRELSKTGAAVHEDPDGLTIEPAFLHGATLDTHHDHRLAMAFGVLGTKVEGIEINDPDAVAKSWPDYWELLEWVTAKGGGEPSIP